MAVVEVTISGVLYDKLNRTTQQVVLVGEGSLTGLGVGGGPIYPPPSGGGGENPPSIWPERPPHIWGGPIDPYPGHPLPQPPDILPVPPGTPDVPPPGSPPVVVSGTHPVHPIVPPVAVLMEYPGIGKVIVPQPLTAQPK